MDDCALKKPRVGGDLVDLAAIRSGATTTGTPPDVVGAELVGRKIQVYWSNDKAWYEGTIKSFDTVSHKHRIRYDDGEVEELVLSKETVSNSTAL